MRKRDGIRSRSGSRSRSRRGLGAESRQGSGLCLGSRTVCLDEVGVRIRGEKSSRSKECFGDNRGQSSGFNKVQQFQQFKVVKLYTEEVRKRIEEYFWAREVLRRI